MNINYKQILINVIEHFSDVKIQYFFITIIMFLLWIFLASVSLNRDLISKTSFDINELHASMNIIMQGVWLFFILSLFGCFCSIWIIIQEAGIRQLIKEYKLSVVK